jgi:hypothetical protein
VWSGSHENSCVRAISELPCHKEDRENRWTPVSHGRSCDRAVTNSPCNHVSLASPTNADRPPLQTLFAALRPSVFLGPGLPWSRPPSNRTRRITRHCIYRVIAAYLPHVYCKFAACLLRLCWPVAPRFSTKLFHVYRSYCCKFVASLQRSYCEFASYLPRRCCKFVARLLLLCCKFAAFFLDL